MTNKLTKAEQAALNVIIDYTRNTRNTAEGVTGWGGHRPGAGRKPTGRKRQTIYVTDDEHAKVKEFIQQLRAAE